MFKSILVPTDGSDSAGAAVGLAADLAAKYAAKLTLLHVVFRGGDVPVERVKDAEAKYDAAIAAGGESPSKHTNWSRDHQILDYMGELILDEAASAAGEKGVPQVETQLDYGATAERVKYWEQHAGIDLIVMGSRGYSELRGLLLGSVSHTVHQQCKCGCVTVRLREHEGPDAFSGMETVLVAVDGSEHAYKAVEVASSIALLYGAKLQILHVLLKSASVEQLLAQGDPEKLSQTSREFLYEREAHYGPAWALDLGLSTTKPAKQLFTEIGEQVLVAARRIAERNGLATVHTHIDKGDPASCIIACAKKEKADIIVVGDRGLGEVKGMLVGSVSNKVQQLAPCTSISVKRGGKRNDG